MMNYRVIEIFTSESSRWNGKPLHDAVLGLIAKQKLAARCIMTRGLAGCYENGDVATWRIEILSFNMPLKIEIVLPASQADSLLPTLQEMVTDGVVGVHDLIVASHRTQKHLLPTHLLVRDVMTPNPKSVTLDVPATDIVRILLSTDFNGVPVVDDAFHPVGIVTQEDLIGRAGMPVRLGLLAAMSDVNRDIVLQNLQIKASSEIMSSPVVTIAEDQQLTTAVRLMLDRHLKRLPVVDSSGRLVGILARYDIFHTITTETPDWKELQKHKIVLTEAKTVGDIMQRDTHIVPSTATLEEVMRIIDSSGLQRVAVVDDSRHLLGMISDRDLLRLFAGHSIGVWDRIASKFTFTEMERRHQAVMEQAQKDTAGKIMKTDLVTVREDALIEEAIRLMTTNKIKRLPVVGTDGEFKGMLSRDSLLRAGIPHCQTTA
jgi:CBS domain-containing protein